MVNALTNVRFLGQSGHSIQRVSRANPKTLAVIKKALEQAGVEFTNGKRPGSRPKG